MSKNGEELGDGSFDSRIVFIWQVTGGREQGTGNREQVTGGR